MPVAGAVRRGAASPPWQRAVPPARRPAGGQDVPDQVDGQDVGQGLGGEPPPAGAAGGQLGVHRPHRGPELRQVQGVERRDRHPRRVEAERLGADVDVKTVNGSINVSTAGLARAETVNGSITAVVGRADWPAGLQFKTVNGGIDLTLPASLSARVEAKTLNGEITSDFPLTVSGTFSRRRLSGTIGSGGDDRKLILETVNGSVQIRRAS